MSWMTPQLLTAVAPLFNLGGKLLAQSGKVDAGKSLAIMGTVLGATGSIVKGFGPTAKTGTKLSEAAGKAGTDFGKSLTIGEGGILGKQNLSMLSSKPFGIFGDVADLNPNFGVDLQINNSKDHDYTEGIRGLW